MIRSFVYVNVDKYDEGFGNRFVEDSTVCRE